MSSPEVRIAAVPQTDSPTDAGLARRCRPGSGPAASRPAAWPVSQASRDGTALRVDGVEVAAGRQHVDQPAQRRAARAGRHVTRRRGRAAPASISLGGRRPAAGSPRSAANRSSTLAVSSVRPRTSAGDLAAPAGSQPASFHRPRPEPRAWPSTCVDRGAGLRASPSSARPSASPAGPGIAPAPVPAPHLRWRCRIASTRPTRAASGRRARRARAGRRGSGRP